MSTDTSSATDRAQETASAVADHGQHVAGVAAEQTRSVATEAKQQAKSVAADARDQVQTQLSDQSRQGKDWAASTLSTFADEARRMAENGSGLAADVAREVSDRAQSLSQHLEGHEPTELLEDVRRLARQRPGTFLLGALAAGVVVGRLVRGTKDAVEAAEAYDQPHATPGAPNTTEVHASHGQPTQPPIPAPIQPYGTGDVPASATGYSAPPAGTGLGGGGI